jgi:hypothetical protein
MRKKLALATLMVLGSLGLKAQTINITAPKNGDVLKKNDKITVTWTVKAGAPDTMQIYLFLKLGTFVSATKVCSNVPVKALKATFITSGGLEYGPGYWLEAVPKIVVDSPISQRVTLSVQGDKAGMAEGTGLQTDIKAINYGNSTLTVDYSLAGPGTVHVCLYDIAGRQIVNSMVNSTAIGTRQDQFFAGNLRGGMYIFRLESGNAFITRKIFVSGKN